MRAKSVVGLAAIIVAIWVWTTLNQRDFERDVYSLCLGRIGTGPTVSDDERGLCACATRQLMAAEPLISRLPGGIANLDEKKRVAALSRPTCGAGQDQASG